MLLTVPIIDIYPTNTSLFYTISPATVFEFSGIFETVSLYKYPIMCYPRARSLYCRGRRSQDWCNLVRAVDEGRNQAQAVRTWRNQAQAVRTWRNLPTQPQNMVETNPCRNMQNCSKRCAKHRNRDSLHTIPALPKTRDENVKSARLLYSFDNVINFTKPLNSPTLLRFDSPPL